MRGRRGDDEDDEQDTVGRRPNVRSRQAEVGGGKKKDMQVEEEPIYQLNGEEQGGKDFLAQFEEIFPGGKLGYCSDDEVKSESEGAVGEGGDAMEDGDGRGRSVDGDDDDYGDSKLKGGSDDDESSSKGKRRRRREGQDSDSEEGEEEEEEEEEDIYDPKVLYSKMQNKRDVRQ